MNLDKSINSLSQRLNKLYPDTSPISVSSNNCNDGVNYWKGKRIISVNQWLKIEQDYTLEAALQYFHNDFLSVVFPFNMDSIDNPKLKEDANKWYSDFEDLMEYRRNPIYGNRKCFNCTAVFAIIIERAILFMVTGDIKVAMMVSSGIRVTKAILLLIGSQQLIIECKLRTHLYSSPQSPIASNKLFDFVHMASMSL
ncbi:MAG: hypothetical protein WBL88_02555 [Nitrososphaeraceae archaeon]